MNNAFWRELLDQIPSAVLLFRIDEKEDAHVMFANDAIRDITGYPPAELVLESEQDASLRTAFKSLVDAIAVKSQSKDTTPGHWQFTTRTGTVMHLQFTFRIFSSRTAGQHFIVVEIQEAAAAPAPQVQPAPAPSGDFFVAESPSLKAIVERFTWFAGQPVNLVFTGDTGSGKKTLAGRFAEYHKNRSGQPWRSFSASEVNGWHEFLSAPEPVKAVWELDKLSLERQQELIKSQQTNPVRLIATASSALELLLDRNQLLPELVYSLNFVSVTVPPLHRRLDDAAAYLNMLASQWSVVFSSASEAAEALLQQIDEPGWDGNFLSLRGSLRRLCVDMEPDSTYDDPQFELFGEAGLPGPLTFNEYNRAFLKTVLKFTKGKIYGDDGAAKLLGLKPTTLQSKLKKLGIR